MAAWYSMLGDKLYKKGFLEPLMLCVSQEEAKGILEEIHEGSCGSHIGVRSLAGKILKCRILLARVTQGCNQIRKNL
jgi:hypothetical protein